MAVKQVHPISQAAFNAMLPQYDLHPMAQSWTLFRLIEHHARRQHFVFRPGTRDFEIARLAISRLLSIVAGINTYRFWHNIDINPQLQFHEWANQSPEERAGEIDPIRKLLRRASIGQNDLVKAMNVLEQVCRGMQFQFTSALMPAGAEDNSHRLPEDFDENDGIAIQRYMCASRLDPIVELFDDVWVPLRKKLRKHALGIGRLGEVDQAENSRA